MVIKTAVQSNFIEGMSQDDRLAGASQYAYGENIDVFTNPDYIQLSTGANESMTTSDSIFNMVELYKRGSTPKVVCFGNDDIYHAGNATPVYTNGAMDNMQYPAFTLDGYLYWVHSTGTTSAFSLNRIDFTDALTTSWSGATSLSVGYKTISNNDNYVYSSVKVIERRAYIALGKIINIFDSSDETVTESDIIKEEIVGIADTYSGLLVFTDVGVMYVIDYTAETIYSSKHIGIKPTKVYQMGSEIYLLGGGRGTEKGLYYFDGAKAQPIYTETYSGAAGKYKFYFQDGIQTMTNNGDKIYLVDKNESGVERLCFYGAKIPGQKKGIHYINTVNNAGDEPSTINSILYSQGNLYFSWSTISADGVDVLGGRNSSGYLITNVRDYETGILRKNFKGVYFRVRDVDATRTIKLSVSQDGDAFVDIRTINEMPLNGVVRIEKNELVSAGVTGDFEDLSWKFTLTGATNATPKVFKGFATYFEQLPII